MPIKEFPPVELADEHGLLAVGGDLSVSSLVLAYRSGVFPWPSDDRLLAWFSPPERAVLYPEQFHQSQSLTRTIRRQKYVVTFNKDFSQVIQSCAATPRPGQPGTWITPKIRAAYNELFSAGFAYSVETWLGAKLVGGIYGVKIGNSIAAESMFHVADDASKVALAALVKQLRSHSIRLLDCQVMNPFLEKLGVTQITREDFLRHVRTESAKPLSDIFAITTELLSE